MYSIERVYALQRTIESQNRTIAELRSKYSSNWKSNQEMIRLKEQNEDFRKANKDLARRNHSLQQAIARERKVMYQSNEDLRKQATDLKKNTDIRLYAYKNELAQANEKIILDAEKIQNQRNQLRNLNKKQEQFNLRPVFKQILSLLVTPLYGDLIETDNTAPRVTLVALVELGHFEHSFRRGDTHLDRITGA